MIGKIKQLVKKWINQFPLLKHASKLALIVVQPNIKKNPFIALNNNKLICYRLYGRECNRVEPLASVEGRVTDLSETLIQAPDIVKVQGNYYDLRHPGVYRFYQLNTISEQRIVGDRSFEVINQCIGYLWSYGFEKMLENNLSAEANFLHQRILVAGCVDIAHIAQTILTKYEIRSRIVAFQTLNAWGGQDDGHTLLEVLSEEGKWFIYDPSFGVLITKNSSPLNALELQTANQIGIDYDIYRLPHSTSHSSFRHSGYDYGFWIDEKYHNDDVILAWYRDMASVALFYEKGRYLFSDNDIDPVDIRRLCSLNFIPKRKSFIKTVMYKNET